jgi:hypothetical protein
MDVIRQRKYLVLLLALIVLLVLQPLAHGPVGGLILFEVVATLVLLAIFLVVFERALHRLVALAAAATAIACNWAGYVLPGQAQVVSGSLYHGALVLFLSYAVVVILQGIFKQKAISSDAVLGGLCGYLLAGLAWANLYALVNDLVPGSFTLKQDLAWQLTERHGRRFLFNYFSFVTLTSLGTGDIAPTGPGATSLMCIEAMFGQFYIAVVVAQVVGLKLAQAAAAPVGGAQAAPEDSLPGEKRGEPLDGPVR